MIGQNFPRRPVIGRNFPHVGLRLVRTEHIFWKEILWRKTFIWRFFLEALVQRRYKWETFRVQRILARRGGRVKLVPPNLKLYKFSHPLHKMQGSIIIWTLSIVLKYASHELLNGGSRRENEKGSWMNLRMAVDRGPVSLLGRFVWPLFLLAQRVV